MIELSINYPIMGESIGVEEKMKKYLSIGEVAKLKGVGVKSLRYYDRIGVLKPAYVDPETRYRYYAVEQLATLDMIFVCLELDIPLKTFQTYRVDAHTVDLKALIEEGQRIAAAKIAAIQEVSAKMASFSRNMADFNQIRDRQGPYVRTFEKRGFLVAPYDGAWDDAYRYAEAATALYFKAKALGLVMLYNQGYMQRFTEAGVETAVCVEVEGDDPAVMTLPAGDCDCELLKGAAIEGLQKRAEAVTYPAGTVVVYMELFDVHFEKQPAYMEIQICRGAFGTSAK